MTVICLVISWMQGLLVCANLEYHNQDGGHYTNTVNSVNTREFLLSLKHKPLSLITPNIDFDLDDLKARKKKRGSRGGIRNYLCRRGARLPMPAVILTNARSLANKTDKL